MAFTYRYVLVDPAVPPAPFVLVNIGRHGGANTATDVAAKLDTGADRTVIPTDLAARLGLVEVERLTFAGLGGQPVELPVFHVRLVVRDLPLILVKVAASDGEPYILLGRDVLNSYRIVLDGPNQKLEIG